MKNTSIRIKLIGIFLTLMMTVGALNLYLVSSLNDFETTKNSELESFNEIYALVLGTEISFKQQVQEWNNMLIRGYKEKDFKKYSKKFEFQRLSVISKIEELTTKSKKFPAIRKKSEDFLESHTLLTKRYYNAIKILNKSNIGYREVDKKVRGLDRPPTTLLRAIQDDIGKLKLDIKENQKAAKSEFFLKVVMIALLLISILSVLFAFLIEMGVLKPIKQLSSVVDKVSKGEYSIRSNLKTTDEMGLLATSFDNLLDDRAMALKQAEEEKNKLNKSIIDLLKSVSILSKKDLTVHAPVTEDAVGSVADAINLMSSETAKTLQGVSDIALRVNEASSRMEKQSLIAIGYSASEKEETDAMIDEMDNAVTLLEQVATFSQVTNNASKTALETTDKAMDAVSETVSSINSIRDVIREIEKRIKRLGERSQEISSIVNVINEISERTHVLGLNAAMQAAQAGEAGKGFIVVAKEVQRLAENSREATKEISSLVKNIQTDTNDTISTMNTVTSSVVNGNELADIAKKKMEETKITTEDLASFIVKIAEITHEQVELGQSLKSKAKTIGDTASKTNIQLTEQLKLSESLAEDADNLISEVRIFKLPVKE